MRDWIALYPGIFRSRKWRALRGDDTGRLAWIALLLESSQSTPEGTIEDRDTAVWLLQRNGIGADAATVDRLVVVGCLDPREDGSLAVRGWSKWQKRWRGPSDDPEAAAARMRALRSNRSTMFDQKSNGSIEERRREERRREESASAYPGTDDPPDSLDRFYEITMLRPWGKPSGRWLREIEANYGGPEPVIAALNDEIERDRNPQDLIGRVEARLAKAADRKRQEVARVARVARPPGVSPEVAARQQAALAEMIGVPGHRGPERVGGVPPEKRGQG